RLSDGRRRSVDRWRRVGRALRLVDVDGDAGTNLRAGADVYADAAAGVTAPAEAPAAHSDADAAAAVALGRALEQHAVRAEFGGCGPQLADHGVHLVLLPVGEATAGGFQECDLVVPPGWRGVVDLHLLGRDSRARG